MLDKKGRSVYESDFSGFESGGAKLNLPKKGGEYTLRIVGYTGIDSAEDIPGAQVLGIYEYFINVRQPAYSLWIAAAAGIVSATAAAAVIAKKRGIWYKRNK